MHNKIRLLYTEKLLLLRFFYREKEVVVAQLEERSLPTPKDLDLKAVIGIEDLLTVRKRQR